MADATIDASKVVITTSYEDPATGEIVTKTDKGETRVAGDPARVAQLALISQAKGAVQNNNDYLALATPTNAQVAAQVRSLTQQMNRVIPLLLGA